MKILSITWKDIKIFFKEPGTYQVQVISDRVMTHSSDLSKLSVDKHTLINSLILKPMVN